MLAAGLEKGDRIGIWGPNTLQWYVTHMAAAKAGLVLVNYSSALLCDLVVKSAIYSDVQVNINPAYQARELKYALKKVGVKCLVMDDTFRSQNYYEILNSVVPEVGQGDPGKTTSSELPKLQTVVSMNPKALP